MALRWHVGVWDLWFLAWGSCWRWQPSATGGGRQAAALGDRPGHAMHILAERETTLNCRRPGILVGRFRGRRSTTVRSNADCKPGQMEATPASSKIARCSFTSSRSATAAKATSARSAAVMRERRLYFD